MITLYSGESTVTAESGHNALIQHGAVDLSSVNYPIDAISLEGEWEFYKNRLLTPEQITIHAEEPDYIQVPQPWDKQRIDGQLLTGVKVGTYRLQLKLSMNEIGRQKALYISDIASAYTVWVDGQMLGGIGSVGKTITEEVPQSREKMIFFEPKGMEVEVVIQASNFTSRSEGTFEAIKFGDADHLLDFMVKRKLTAALTIGGLLVIGLYHLIIYGIRRSDRSTLFIGLLAMDIGVRGWIRDTYLVDILAPFMSWETVVKFDYLTGHIAYMFLVMLMNRMFPQEMNRRVAVLSHVLTFLFCLYILIMPASVYTKTLSIQFGLMLMISIYTIGYVCILAVKRKREGALINMIGYIIIAIACINDVMLFQRIIETAEILYDAIFIFVLMQAIITSYRYSRLFNHNVALSSDLQQLNQTLELKVEDRTADLHRKNKELAQMHHSRTEMLANISHDMGSPLIGIQMNMQLMKDGLVNAAKQPEFVQSLLDKAAYVKRLNDDLFELSLLESGQLQFQFKRFQLRSYMEDMIRRMIADLASQQIELQIGSLETLLEENETWIHADAKRIKQVLNNYVGNAVKFSRSLNSIIVINCSIVPAKNKGYEIPYEVVIEVKDQGPGMEEGDLSHVFERFYRKIEGNASGSGLGLAIVKEIVERHQGRVGVVSKLGEGSTFSFTLPVYRME